MVKVAFIDGLVNLNVRMRHWHARTFEHVPQCGCLCGRIQHLLTLFRHVLVVPPHHLINRRTRDRHRLFDKELKKKKIGFLLGRKMRSVVIDAAALEEKQAAFFASKDASISTGLLVGRMTGAKDHIVSAVVLREFSLAARSCSKRMLL